MSKDRVSRVVVIDEENRPIGIITRSDITLANTLPNISRLYVAGGSKIAAEFLKRAVTSRRIVAMDFMTEHPLCVNQSSNLSVAAKLMSIHGISGLPVATESGTLAGIVCKTDITQAVAYGKRLESKLPLEMCP
jgi:CBS domain-containing protein